MASAEGQIVSLHLLKSVLQEDPANKKILEKCEVLEKAMNSTKGFCNKTEMLISVIESLNVWLKTECIRRIPNEITSLLFRYLLRHTLMLVFHGDWGLNKAVKLHMRNLFKQIEIIAEKNKVDGVVHHIDYLLDIMGNDPWENPGLMIILSGGRITKIEDKKVFNFVKQELGIFLFVRVEVMVLAKCEIQALSLIEKSLSCISSNSNNFLPSFFYEVRHLRDLHLILLNKAKSNSFVKGKILKEVNEMGLDECLKFVRRCRKGELPFKIVSNKAAEVVLNMALASAVIKDDTDESLLQELIIVWLNTLTDKEVLRRLLRHLVINAVCSRYIYTFGKVLIERFKLSDKALCIEVYVRGLALNVNEVEKYKSNNEKGKLDEHKVQLANRFMELADYLENDILLCREFVLTAFSLDPSLSYFEKIKTLGEKSGKFFVEAEKKNEPFEKNPLVNNEACMMPLDENLASMMDQCAIASAPIVTKEGFSLQDHKESAESKHFCQDSPTTYNESPHLLMSKRSPAHGTDCSNGVEKSTAFMKNASEQIQPNEQILDGNEIADILMERTNCVLSKEISNLSLDDGGNVGKLDKENNPDNTSTHSNCGFSQLIHVYNTERIGIPQTLCDDLSTLVAYGRSQELDWELKWMELKRRCEARLQKENAVQAFANLNIDPDEFRDRQSEINENSKNNSHDTSNVRVNTPIRISKRKRKRKRFSEDYV